MKLAHTFNFSLLTSALLLITSTSAFATPPTSVQAAIGSGVFFYAWNANGHCSTDTSINPTGKCPTLWTDTIKNINAQVPASADRAKIKFIYLDSVAFNFHATNPSGDGKTYVTPNKTFTVGGCGDEKTADIIFCSRSAGLTYSNPQVESDPQAVSELNQILGPNYYILPTVSDSGSLTLLTAGQIESVAYSLACIVNPNAPLNSFSWGAWPSYATGTPPTSCSQILTGANLNPQNLTPIISGLGFDIEPDLSGKSNTGDVNSAQDFYQNLQTFMGASSPTHPLFIMDSRGPNGLNENQNGTTFGTLLNTLNGNTNLATFIFAPQIYDLCDGFGTWACPVTNPFANPNNNSYAANILAQAIPASQIDGKKTWDYDPNGTHNGNDILFPELSASYQFYSALNGHSIPTSTQYPNIPVQLMISGGGSSQIWSHANLYNADFSTFNPAGDQFLTGVNAVSVAPISFQPFMIYENKRACQAENPDGSLGATIPNCVTYPNPYFESLASYANTLFSSLQYAVSTNNSSSVFSGIALYPFTPYGFWDNASIPNPDNKKLHFLGYFPEIPDGLINGQKPQISFWDTYLNQFANQWIGSSTGTIPAQTDTPASKLFITLPANYYTLNPGSGNTLGTATVAVNTATYPNNSGLINNIAGYKANLIDAIGQIVATGSCYVTSPINGITTPCTAGPNSTESISIPNAPGGNYKLEVQALDSNGNVIASTEAAAEGAGLPPVPAYWIDGLKVVGTPTSSSYTLSWTLHCTTPPTGVVAMSQLYLSNGTPTSNSISLIASTTCGSESATFVPNNSKYPFSTQSTRVSLYVVNGKTLQSIAPAIPTIQISISS